MIWSAGQQVPHTDLFFDGDSVGELSTEHLLESLECLATSSNIAIWAQSTFLSRWNASLPAPTSPSEHSAPSWVSGTPRYQLQHRHLSTEHLLESLERLATSSNIAISVRAEWRQRLPLVVDGSLHQRLKSTDNRRDIDSLFFFLLLTCNVHWSYHRLRGSASPVLTATGFVNGKGQFRPLQNRHSSTDHQKFSVTGDYVGDLYSCAKLVAHTPTGGGGFLAHG